MNYKKNINQHSSANYADVNKTENLLKIPTIWRLPSWLYSKTWSSCICVHRTQFHPVTGRRILTQDLRIKIQLPSRLTPSFKKKTVAIGQTNARDLHIYAYQTALQSRISYVNKPAHKSHRCRREEHGAKRSYDILNKESSVFNLYEPRT